MTQVYLGKNLVSSLDSKDLNYDNTTSGIVSTNVQDAITEVSKNANNEVELTQAEYDALEQAGKIEPDVNYYIIDSMDDSSASAIFYDNATSGLSANTVQSAIDEIVSNGVGSGGHVELTQEEYNALVEAGNIDPNVVYYITDGEDKLNASTIAYDNSTSGMEESTVQGAIDELNKKSEKIPITLYFPENNGASILSTNILHYQDGIYYIDIFVSFSNTISDNATVFTILKNSNAVTFNKRIDFVMHSFSTTTHTIKGVVLLPYTNYFFANGSDIPSGTYKITLTIFED